MPISPIPKGSPEDYAACLTVWKSAVRATHDFLQPADFEFYMAVMSDLLAQVELYVLRCEGEVVAFAGVSGESLEMLFVAHPFRGQGCGKKLLEYAVGHLHTTKVDVNEENRQALGFYRKFGFRITGRSERDAMGKAYPILHLIHKTMNTSNIQIRETTAGDFNSIMEVETQAFGYDKEALLTAALLADKTADPILSLLAFHDGKPAGHILFTRARFSGRQEQPMMHILAPLAVKPEYQRQGIGGMLIEAGIEKLREKGSNLVFVLGHKEYYPRHGFIPGADRLGYPAPHPIPEAYSDYWMVQTLSPQGFDVGRGKIECCDELNKPEHWRDDESDR